MAALGPARPGSKDLPQYAKAEVATRTSVSCSWVTYERGVYDITAYAAKHPGGDQILRDFAGTDIAHTFETFFHSRHARQILQGLQVGWLRDAPKRNLLAPPGGVGPKSALLGSRGRELTPGSQGRSPAVSPGRVVPSAPSKPKLPAAAVPLSVRMREQLTDDLALVELSGALPFELAAGQHVMVWADIGGKLIRRPYTPLVCTADSLLLLVKRYPGGTMSNQLHSAKSTGPCPAGGLTRLLGGGGVTPSVSADHPAEVGLEKPAAGSGDEHSLWVTGPQGGDLQPLLSRSPRVLLFAAGTGITAFWRCLQQEDGVLRRSLDGGSSSINPMLLLVWSIRKPPRAMLEHLAKFQRAHGNEANKASSGGDAALSAFSAALVDPEGAELAESCGLTSPVALRNFQRVDAECVGAALAHVRSTGPGVSGMLALVCGPPDYNDEVESYLRSHKFDGEIHRLE